MKSFFRLYAKTSKGNDACLVQELKALGIEPHFEEVFKAFYFQGNFETLFHLSFHSFALEQLYIQIGGRFTLTQDSFIQEELTRIPFMNYLPIQRGLIENTTLKIVIKESSEQIQEHTLIRLLTSVLQSQIAAKEYYGNIAVKDAKEPRDRSIPHFQIRNIVHRKWEQEDFLFQKERDHEIKQIMAAIKQNRLLPDDSSKAFPSRSQQKSPLEDQLQIMREKTVDSRLKELLPYSPHLIFYVRKNRGRILLKLNQQELYKHGWKKKVGWAPVRESIAASMLTHSGILKSSGNKQVLLWDPFCGSGTIPLVASTMCYQVPIRSQYLHNFVWPYFKIYKPEYLTSYLDSQSKNQDMNLKVVASDNDMHAVDATLQNFEALLQQLKLEQSADPLLVYHLSEQVYEVIKNRAYVIHNDFEKVLLNLINRCKEQEKANESVNKINIVTNLPYANQRSVQHHPLNQLQSIYRRFSKMILKNREYIQNVFVLVNTETGFEKNRNHFLHVSDLAWDLVANFKSGGLEIAMYGWSSNVTQALYLTDNEIVEAKTTQLAELKPEISEISAEYRSKISEIDKRHYNLPQKLRKQDLTGWKRVLEKRRVRHLQTAYAIFSKRKDKMIALRSYMQQKLEEKMLRRSRVWKDKNLGLVGNEPEKYEAELRKEFESRIQFALERAERRKEQMEQKKQARIQQREKSEKPSRKRSQSRSQHNKTKGNQPPPTKVQKSKWQIW